MKHYLIILVIAIALANFGCNNSKKNNSSESIHISGKVTNSAGDPVDGAIVKLKLAGQSVTTNEAGQFLITGTPVKPQGIVYPKQAAFIDTITVQKSGYLTYQMEVTNPLIDGIDIIPAKNDLPEVSKEYVFESSPNFASCHSSSIVELQNGDLLCTFFAGSREAAPDVEIYLSRKKPGGSWSAPVSVANGDEGGERMSTGNPVLFRDRMGALILFYKVIKPDVGFVGRMKTSNDNGYTWSKATQVGDSLMGAVKNKPIQLHDGIILSPSSTEDHKGWRVHVERSEDGGKTWQLIGPLNPEAKIGAIQPTLLTYPDGSIQLLARTRSEFGFITQSWSKDEWLTWSPLEPTVLPNNNSGIDGVTLRDGQQLLVYNHSTRNQKGMGHKGRGILNVALSKDGIHWQASLILEYLDQKGKQFSYPSVIQTHDGLVHIVYTWHRLRIKHVVINPKRLKSAPMPDGKWPVAGPFSLNAFKQSQQQ